MVQYLISTFRRINFSQEEMKTPNHLDFTAVRKLQLGLLRLQLVSLRFVGYNLLHKIQPELETHDRA